MPYLILNPGRADNKIFPLQEGQNTIGRSDLNSVCIPHISMSRQHARIDVTGDSALLFDLQSRNGTLVNDNPVMKVVLNDRDRLQCGEVTLLFVTGLESFRNAQLQEKDNSPTNLKALPVNATRISMADLLAQNETMHPGAALRLKDQDSNQRVENKLKILLEITSTLSSPDNINRVLDKILHLLFQVMKVDRAAVLMLNEVTNELEMVAMKTASGKPVSEHFYSRNIIDYVVEKGVAVLSSDARFDPRFDRSKSIVQQSIQSTMCAPLKPKDQTLGVIYIDNVSLSNLFTEEDLEFLIGFANQAALAIENSKLYTEMEEKVVQRTAELASTIERLKRSESELSEKNRQILDSIHYAERIQRAILPTSHSIHRAFGDCFVLYRPKDIVSGDFYWFQDTEDSIVVAVGDCTGHGVPGAFMSMIGYTLLNQIVVEKGIHDPAGILENLHNGIRSALSQDLGGAETEDGLDIALCRIDRTGQTVVFSGARRPLYGVNGFGEFIEVKGDKKSIGGRQKEPRRIFSNHYIPIGDSLTLYLTTDGFGDQPGDLQPKFTTRRLREFLHAISPRPMPEQYHRLAGELNAHQGSQPQRDDITIVGLRVIPHVR